MLLILGDKREGERKGRRKRGSEGGRQREGGKWGEREREGVVVGRQTERLTDRQQSSGTMSCPQCHSLIF